MGLRALRHRDRRGDGLHLRRVRGLQLPARARYAPAPGHLLESQEDQELMREHDLQPTIRRRYVATTDSDHDGPIFANQPRKLSSRSESALGVGHYLRRDHCRLRLRRRHPRHLVAPGRLRHRPVDQRPPDAALKVAIERRKPPFRCVRHSDRGLQGRPGLTRSWMPRPSRLDGAAPQPLRKRQGEELHENHEGRSRLPDGIRELRQCRGGSFTLHR